MFIITNIISNTIQSITSVQDNLKELTLTVYARLGNVYVTVKNTGIDIAEEDLSKIFRHHSNNIQDRTGFELHSSSNYMKEMGGKIWAEGQGSGAGATFVLEFPIRAM
ncbi:ATP-binding protein [bacterium]|nr:ATP-binding protein [bacterium]